MATWDDIATLISQASGICGGCPSAGTLVSVRRITGSYQMGLCSEEIGGQCGHLTWAQVSATPAYDHTNHDARDAELAAEEDEYGRLEAAHRDPLQRPDTHNPSQSQATVYCLRRTNHKRPTVNR
jgi:uncharacterized protein (DUF433 family)